MKIKMQEVLQLKDFFDKIKSVEMPIKTAYKMNRILKKVEGEIEFYQLQFNNILNKYAKKNEKGEFILTSDGQGVEIEQEKIEDCQNEFLALSQLEIEVDKFSFSLEELESINLTIADINGLMSFIEE